MNLEQLFIEDLAQLRDQVITALSDKVAARQKERAGHVKTLHSAS